VREFSGPPSGRIKMTIREDEIYRQDCNTDVDEVIGHVCEEFLEVRGIEEGEPHYFYLKLSGLYHRFSLDAGLLFWRSHQEPDPEYDLDLDCRYVNLGEELKVIGVAVEKVHMGEDRLDMVFGNGVRLEIQSLFAQDNDGMRLEVVREA